MRTTSTPHPHTNTPTSTCLTPHTLLRPCRYSHAEQVFRVQSNLDQAVAEELTGKQGQSHSLDTDAGLQDLLFCVAAEANPQAYVDSFDQLAAWADSSLDLYRVRL